MAFTLTWVSSILLAICVGAFAVFWVLFNRTFKHFKKMGVPYDQPLPFVGNFLPVLLRKTTFVGVMDPLYEKYKEAGYCGFFNWRTPILVVCEPSLIKQVLTKDFNSFHDRGLPYDEEGDPLSAHLFNLSGTKWRNLRNKLSPTFTSGKMKNMFPLMVDVANELNSTVMDMISKDKELEMKQLTSRYAVDLIGSVAFGMTCNSLKDNNVEFMTMARQAIKPSFAVLARFFLASINPLLARLLPFKLIFPEMTKFFLDLMKDTVEYREKNKVERNDFVHLMMQLRESDKSVTDRENFIEFTHSIMTAQAFIFFIAGLDNISNSVSFALHELSLNPELQQRAAEEVRETLNKYDGKMTYEALQQMGLIGRIVDETLRKWTPVGALFRKATAKTVLGNTGLVIEKGQAVFVPVQAMHLDPEFYPDPMRFDPDRFTAEAKEARNPYTYLPFGEGPRVCIAERFALMEMKLCLASLLNKYTFSVGPKTEVEIVMDKGAFGPTPKNGIFLTVNKRQQD